MSSRLPQCVIPPTVAWPEQPALAKKPSKRRRWVSWARWLQKRQQIVALLALYWSLGLWTGMAISHHAVVWPWLLVLVSIAVLSSRVWVLKGVLVGLAFWLGVGMTSQPLSLPPLGQVVVSGWLTQPRLFQVEQVYDSTFKGDLSTPFLMKLNRLPVGAQSATLPIGQPMVIHGESRLGFEPALPGTFNEQAYLTGLHAAGVLTPKTIQPQKQTVVSGLSRLVAHTAGLRTHLAQQLALAFPHQPAHQALMGGLLLGDDAMGLPKTYEQALVATGLLHIVSASGANLVMVAGLLLLLCRPIRHRWIRRTLLVVGVTAYAWLTGFPPSIQRAYAMLAIGTALKWLGLPFQPMTLLLLAVACLLTVMPWLSQSLGFQLSVLATAGIVWLVPWFDQIRHNAKGVTHGHRIDWQQWFMIPFAAELAVLPWASSIFHQWSWAALPMNVAMDGLIVPLTWLASLGSVLCGLGLPEFGQWVWQMAYPLLWVFNQGVNQVSHWPGVLQYCPQWPAASLVCWYGLLAVLPVVKKARLKPLLTVGMMGVIVPWLLHWAVLYSPHTRMVALASGDTLRVTHTTDGWCSQKPPAWLPWQQRAFSTWLAAQGIPATANQPCL
jgi:ComEC/Rec2-related protein